jgi:hypothetical protein
MISELFRNVSLTAILTCDTPDTFIVLRLIIPPTVWSQSEEGAASRAAV